MVTLDIKAEFQLASVCVRSEVYGRKSRLAEDVILAIVFDFTSHRQALMAEPRTGDLKG